MYQQLRRESCQQQENSLMTESCIHMFSKDNPLQMLIDYTVEGRYGRVGAAFNYHHLQSGEVDAV